MFRIPFNIPYTTGKELDYIQEAISKRKLSGNGYFTDKCQQFFQKKYDFGKCLLTSSCTDALEMSALLLDIQPGDEVIMPSYTFVSTANAFVLRGATIRFIDSRMDHPGLDEDLIEMNINHKTKAIVVVHYAGVACDMEKIMRVSEKHSLWVVEDAAHSIDSYYFNEAKRKALGSIGHLATFSFHETKNINSGEGGMLVVNDPTLKERAEIIWEKGTNRSAFFRGEVDKYNWVDIGSSFLPSEITAAFLWAQLEDISEIQKKRIKIWELYNSNINSNPKIRLPEIPDYGTNNGHMYYLVCSNPELRDSVIFELKSNNILAVFHYLSLHKSPYYKDISSNKNLPNSDNYSDCLVRLPFYADLEGKDVLRISEIVNDVVESY
jgi:dTDP-4-amino-4,6-dideoxygalactose transaminase